MFDSAKRRTKRRWDEEWGKLTTEGNIWWLGSVMQNWRAVMGDDVLTWICEYVVFGWDLIDVFISLVPIGRSKGDGLAYPVNPRFDEEGRWRRRKEWPVDLQ